ncbi:RagB/SusD family nutrient uptake outer membrane protein [Algoriphagus chordae]|uniref:Putative outer membrane starch-binding protein n=1 Tax=Algoriphagus chordae TaxID=237019 RepID=A0A2W7QHJ4_9BACT|nr:RagB/SusD family nutrient uptake outer membrane protein [Algoriphagus chordae]PZX47571.1 putative outer membrane starch-binding protein [Algoriphagus chordae]
MKNIKLYLVALVCLGLASCNDEFLDTVPKTQINDANFWNNTADLEIYNNQLYATYFANKGFTGGGMMTEDVNSDNAYAEAPTNVRLGINTANNPGISNWSWSLVRDINQMLENTESSDIEAAARNPYIAEARLIRALDYYDKLKLYGQLPIIDRVLTEDDELLYATQSSRDEVMAFIKSDLDFATEHMASTAVENRFTKAIAQSYKARIMLHEGTFRKYHGLGGEQEYLQEAVSSAEAVINTGQYMIDPNVSYNELFAQTTLSGNKEVIFFKNYDDALQLYHNNAALIKNANGVELGGTKSLVNDYLLSDGLTISESQLYQGDATLEMEFANRDLRLSQTFSLPNTYFAGDQLYLNSTPAGINVSASPSGYQLVKFFNPDQEFANWSRSFSDAPLIRYAEILLIMVEAKAELGTVSQADIDLSVNTLRLKAGVADLVLSESIIEDIRRERRVELAFEGFRFDDLMRWKKGAELANPVLGVKFNEVDIADASEFEIGTDIFLNEDGDVMSNNSYAFDESKNYYFPVPVNELSLNPNLKQTPGWE